MKLSISQSAWVNTWHLCGTGNLFLVVFSISTVMAAEKSGGLVSKGFDYTAALMSVWLTSRQNSTCGVKGLSLIR